MITSTFLYFQISLKIYLSIFILEKQNRNFIFVWGCFVLVCGLFFSIYPFLQWQKMFSKISGRMSRRDLWMENFCKDIVLLVLFVRKLQVHLKVQLENFKLIYGTASIWMSEGGFFVWFIWWFDFFLVFEMTLSKKFAKFRLFMAKNWKGAGPNLLIIYLIYLLFPNDLI